jgi:hypothetical protein
MPEETAALLDALDELSLELLLEDEAKFELLCLVLLFELDDELLVLLPEQATKTVLARSNVVTVKNFFISSLLAVTTSIITYYQAFVSDFFCVKITSS